MSILKISAITWDFQFWFPFRRLLSSILFFKKLRHSYNYCILHFLSSRSLGWFTTPSMIHTIRRWCDSFLEPVSLRPFLLKYCNSCRWEGCWQEWESPAFQGQLIPQDHPQLHDPRGWLHSWGWNWRRIYLRHQIRWRELQNQAHRPW